MININDNIYKFFNIDDVEMKNINFNTYTQQDINSLIKNKKIVGGDPNNILKNCKTLNNNYIIGFDNSTNKYIGYKIIDNDNTKKKCGSNYLAKGTYQAVFKVSQMENLENISNKKYILKIQEENYDMSKYVIDKKLLANKSSILPKIILYGDITCNGIIYHYIITEIYETDFNKLNLSQKKKLMCNLIKILAFLQNKQYIINDLKIANIGYKNNKIIIIDYDNFTITNFYNREESINTYIPSYMKKHSKLEYNIMNKEQYLSIPYIGLTSIFLEIFSQSNQIIQLFDKHYAWNRNRIDILKNEINMIEFIDYIYIKYPNFSNLHHLKDILYKLLSQDNLEKYNIYNEILNKLQCVNIIDIICDILYNSTK